MSDTGLIEASRTALIALEGMWGRLNYAQVWEPIAKRLRAELEAVGGLPLPNLAREEAEKIASTWYSRGDAQWHRMVEQITEAIDTVIRARGA